jgi:hypothetical protein
MMEARQMGLKLIANVTYGYAGASFSGRMPCSDIADSIVQTGRATLEKVLCFFNLLRIPLIVVSLSKLFTALRNGTLALYMVTRIPFLFISMGPERRLPLVPAMKWWTSSLGSTHIR